MKIPKRWTVISTALPILTTQFLRNLKEGIYILCVKIMKLSFFLVSFLSKHTAPFSRNTKD